MTNEEKLNALLDSTNIAWDYAFDGWDWFEMSPNRFLLGENDEEKEFAFFVGVNEEVNNGLFWIEYEPETDQVEVYIKPNSVVDEFKDDFKALFEKYSPFNMKVSFDKDSTPLFSRKEKVKPENFDSFFTEFKNEYQKNYPLFYMFTVSEKQWNDRFYIDGMDF